MFQGSYATKESVVSGRNHVPLPAHCLTTCMYIFNVTTKVEVCELAHLSFNPGTKVIQSSFQGTCTSRKLKTPRIPSSTASSLCLGA